ncbi:MAG: hypothetical protein Q9218_003062 [Villophora microphyllina]
MKWGSLTDQRSAVSPARRLHLVARDLVSFPQLSKKKASHTSGVVEDVPVPPLGVLIAQTIPRTAQTQYHSSMGHHLPRSQAQPGDLIFWATGGDCTNSVAHVGIFMRAGWMVNAAHTGTPVREQSIWTSSGGESICPDAVRFW